MIQRNIQLRNISNVAASKTALIEVPIGPRYHRITLAHGFASGTNTIAGAIANITEIRCKVNGRVQRIFSGAQLRDFNIRNGTIYDCTGVPNTAPGVTIPIFFAEPWMETIGDQEGLAWPSSSFNSMQIEVDLSTASTPTLVAWAIADDFVLPSNQAPAITKVLRQSSTAGGTSFDFPGLDRRDYLRSITIYPDSGASLTPSQVTLRINGDIKWDATYGVNFSEISNSGMYPTASGRTAGIYDLVLDHAGLLNSAYLLTGQRDMSLTIAAATAMSGTSVILLEKVGPLE